MVVFNEANHAYTLENGDKCISVTTLVHDAFPVFDADKVIDGIESRKTPKYAGRSRAEIKQMWKANGKRAAVAGTRLHKYIENIYLGVEGIEQRSDDEAQQFHKFTSAYSDLAPYQVEWVVCDPEHRVAGTVDMVFRDKEGLYHIYDWKRSAKIVRNRFNEDYCLVPELDYIPNTNYWHYSLQLNTYKAILMEKYGMRIGNLYLVALHPDNDTYLRIPVVDLQNEVRMLFNDRLNKLNNLNTNN